MPFQVSPGVNVSEIDLTTVVPAVSTTEGALAGVFRWGPAETRVLVDSEAVLAARFGKPTNLNAETFFTGANFLSYGNKLYVARTIDTTTYNAVANTSTIDSIATFVVKNSDHYDTIASFADTDGLYIAKYPGALGNSLRVSVCDSITAFGSSADIANNGAQAHINTSSNVAFVVGSTSAVVTVGVGVSGTVAECNTHALSLANSLTVGDYIQAGNSTLGIQQLKVTAVSAVVTANSTGGSTSNTQASFTITTENSFALAANVNSNTFIRKWEYYNFVNKAPTISAYQKSFGANSDVVDELHVVVADQNGQFTGVPGSVLEVFSSLSRGTDSKTEDGATNYYKTVINDTSNYLWWANDRAGAGSANSAAIVTGTNSTPLTLNFALGTDSGDENSISLAKVIAGYDMFASAEDVDVSLILTGTNRGGTHGEQLANYIIDNVAEKRKDCVVFVSPQKADVVNNAGDEGTDTIEFRNVLRSTSYAVLDSGYKYQYDKYNDIYRWTPLNGDTAGLCVRTDSLRDAWFSPAGFNRGQIKNIVKLAYNPRAADRDQLYKAGVNPVVTFPGQGTILYGDKTLLAKPSAFDRINVRRLFIVLEKAIATATKFTLFEFNDDFTRSQFRNLVEPFLRDVQGRRGIYDFKVVCDTTNNTGEVIDRNEFIGDIYIKPAKSINYIQLNFVAVRTGVEFSEVVGKF